MSPDPFTQSGLKPTLPRRKILNIFETNKNQHFTAEAIYRALMDEGDEVSLATVYRVLMQFEMAGILVKHNFEGASASYELDHGEHHDHLVCVECGYIEEFVDELIEARQFEITKQAGFKMTDHVLNIYGMCPACIKKNKLKI